MSSKLRSYCPFRVQTPDHQAGCTFQLGVAIKCYSQENRPLLRKNKGFYCPQMGLRITFKTFQQLNSLLCPLMQIQDEFEIAINVWPTMKGLANPIRPVDTLMGNDMVRLAKQIYTDATELILELE